MSPRALSHAEGPRAAVFRKMHEAMMGAPVDFSTLRLEAVPASLRDRVRATWLQRFQSEFRSVEIMTRFLGELVNAGEPLEVYAGAVDLVKDEVCHAALCARVVEALGGEVLFPQPVALKDAPAFLAQPFGMRALGTAVTMLAVSETISVAFIRDLQARCEEPALRAVLDATLADEDEHEDFGWAYIELALERGDEVAGSKAEARRYAREMASAALAPHRRMIEQHAASLRGAERDLAAHAEPELARWALFGPVRQALVAERALREVVVPRLRALDLA